MAEIRPFYAVRPKEGFEEKIAALPYDVFSLEEARQEVEGRPLSFLAIDYPETIGADTHTWEEADGVCPENRYERAGRLLEKRIRQGYFQKDELPGFYLYELTEKGRSQTGVCALTCVDDYLDGTICRHENTRADKEKDRILHVEGCMAQTGPIFMAYRAKPEIGAIIGQEKEARAPYCDFTGKDGVRHRLWRIDDVETVEAIYELFEEVERFYIADGHHRCRAAVSFAEKMREEHPDYTGEEPWNFILSVLFADEELSILPYNRVVRDLNGLSEREFLEKAAVHFTVHYIGKAPKHPDKKGRLAMYLQSGWYALALREKYRNTDPVEGLDVALLQRYILAPVLGIQEPRTDERISFVGGIRGTRELEQKVNASGGVAFYLYPTSLTELFCVADAGKLMPPKSTWFEPKLLSGLLIHDIRENGGNYDE